MGVLAPGRRRTRLSGDVRYHAAAGARDRGAAHLGSLTATRPLDAGRRERVHRPPVGRADALASLARPRARSARARSRHDLPRLGIGNGQLAALGRSVLACRPRRGSAALHPRRPRARDRPLDAPDRSRIRPLHLARRRDETCALRRRGPAQGHEFHGRGRLRQCDLRRRVRCSRDDRRGLLQAARRCARPAGVVGSVQGRRGGRRERPQRCRA
ncbi:Uncharacterised protein [Mycobacteroides abscessus subsp. abscessus]|nr:Uncharacterised protein [Mycobacteroides abscessus subsp. abscessus]